MSNARALRLGAVVAALAGVAAGVVLMLLSTRSREQAVAAFARAPVGCTTTLQFDRAATFTLYLETKGTVGDLGGDCAANDSSYDHAGSLPQVRIALVDAAGAAVPMSGAPSRRYDTGAFVGVAVQQVNVTPGSYELTVISDSTDVAIAVGRDPEADSSVLQAAASAVALLGLVVGGVLLLVARHRHSAPPTAGPGTPSLHDEQWRPRLPVDPFETGHVSPPPRPAAAPTAPWAPPPPPPPLQPPGWGAPNP